MELQARKRPLAEAVEYDEDEFSCMRFQEAQSAGPRCGHHTWIPNSLEATGVWEFAFGLKTWPDGRDS